MVTRVKIETIHLGTPVRFADYGGEGPPIVLVHGLGGLHLNWMRIAPELTKRGRVLALDLPGFGGSPPPRGGVTMEALATTALRFLDAKALCRDAPVTLFGNSLGGALSLLLAARAPDRIARLVLISPAVPHAIGAPIDRDIAAAMGLAMLPFVGPDAVRRRAHDVGADRLVREGFAWMLHDRSRLPDDVMDAHIAEARDRMAHPWTGDAFSGALRSLFWVLSRRARFGETIRAIKVPALVLAGARDRLVHVDSIRRAAALNPKFELEVWHDVGHVPQLEVPDRVLGRVDRFWSA